MSPSHVPGANRRRLSARVRVWLYCALGLVVIAVSAAVSLRPLSSGQSEVREVRRDNLAQQQLSDLRTTLAEFQLFVEPRLARLAPASVDDLTNGALLGSAVSPDAQAVVKALPAIGLAGTADAVAAAASAFTKAMSGLSVLAPGRSTAAATTAINSERTAFARIWATTASAAAQLRQARDHDLRQGLRLLDGGRQSVFAVDALAALITVLAGVVLGRRSQCRERLEHARARRTAYEATLQRALDMSRAEPDVYGIVAGALHESVPHLEVEMLVADSSRAHFNRALSTDNGTSDEHGGCGVVSPLDCPAIARGHTLVFPTSRALDACPYLRDRVTGECSAACIPVSIAGRNVGVTHATAADREPPTDQDVEDLELTSRRASDRIAMLRAFEKSENQARSDPLTGLWNRRSLENRVRELQREGTPYALAYGDLDHFKDLNDTHGHEAGDQALRLFSRVLRDAIRPGDIAARYGGEEFVILLPDCSTQTATNVLERVRERLAIALTAGRVPSFTVSFGLASSVDADTFDEVLAIADRALFAAKGAGRNRVVVAVDSPETPTAS